MRWRKEEKNIRMKERKGFEGQRREGKGCNKLLNLYFLRHDHNIHTIITN